MSGFARFPRHADVSKALSVLRGLVLGIGADGAMTRAESAALRIWIENQEPLAGRSPFDNLLVVLESAIQNGVLDADERTDLLVFIDRLAPDRPSDRTIERQVLHGLVAGIAADGEVTPVELNELRRWLDDHAGLRGSYPYDEIDALITKVLADGVVDPDEQDILLGLFAMYGALGAFGCALDVDTLSEAGLRAASDARPAMPGARDTLLAAALRHDASDDGRTFCIAGESRHGRPRRAFESKVRELGGIVLRDVRTDLDYLVVGGDGDGECRGLTLYGAKIERAMRPRREGQPLLIVKEKDFWDAVGGVPQE